MTDLPIAPGEPTPPITRRGFVLALVPLALAAASCARAAEAQPLVTVYKTPTCGCCKGWVAHLRESGFEVKAIDLEDLTSIKRQRGVPDALAACHTAIVDGYTIEGHVPADVIRKLLKERPPVLGLVVPGMPAGSPGMESATPEHYEVYTFDRSGPKAIYAAR
ncbi:MAG TPA: DUF411 domain-containing protein [Longimicrobiaceae bacterium]|nr:DUF411 domain-containing protein [Longimicrobiaceae bacterium]